MTVSLLLVALAVVVATVAPRALTQTTWSRRSPRMGIVVWQAAAVSVVTACVLVATDAFLPVERVRFDLGHLLHACPEVVRRGFSSMGSAWPHLVSLLVAGITLALLLRAVVLRALSVRRGRATHRQLVGLLAGEQDPRFGAHVIEHDVPLAYCIPGAGGRVVVTTAAVDALDQQQLAAVMAHENAHLDGRHDLVLFGAAVASSAFPWSRFFRVARSELSVLVEMLADDRALRVSDRDSLVSALVDLGQWGTPESTLGATGETLQRVQRLAAGSLPKPARLARATVLATSLTLVSAPWVIAVAPAWAARSGLCDLPGSPAAVA